MENICRYRWCAMLWRSSVFLREIKTILQAQGSSRAPREYPRHTVPQHAETGALIEHYWSLKG